MRWIARGPQRERGPLPPASRVRRRMTRTFIDFDAYKACVKAQFGLHVRLEDGKRVVDTDEDGGDGDGAREAPGARRTEAQPQVSGGLRDLLRPLQLLRRRLHR